MKKIMVYCHVFYPQNSGYANAFLNFITTLLESEKNIFIYVVTPHPLNNREELKIERLKIIRLSPKIKYKRIQYFANQYFYARRVSNLFKEYNTDLLFVETFDSEIFLSFLDNEIYQKTVVRIHATNETEYTFFVNQTQFKVRRNIIRKYLIRKLKWITATNSFHIKFAKKYFFNENIIDISEGNFFVLPNPILNIYDDTDSLKFPEDRLKFFLLGRMDYLGNNQKGFEDFFYALKLIDKKLLKQLDITIVGKGDMKEYLIKLSKNIVCINFIEGLPHKEVIEYLKNSDVVVLPSRYEGLSMFALESLATGNVCIFSNTGGLTDMIDRNGLLYEPQNIEELANAIETVLLADRKDILKMKKQSIEIARKKFSKEVISSKFKIIYELITFANQQKGF